MNSLLVVLVVLTALVSPSTSVVPAAQAASACEGGSAPVWNETAQRTALVPFSNWDGDYMYEDAYYEDDKPASDEIAEPSESDWDPALHPEERYTYNPTWPLPVLEPLTTGHTVITCRPQITSNQCRPLSNGVQSDTFPGHRTAPRKHHG